MRLEYASAEARPVAAAVSGFEHHSHDYKMHLYAHGRPFACHDLVSVTAQAHADALKGLHCLLNSGFTMLKVVQESSATAWDPRSVA